ncbi:MAG TPA: CLC_0170 family protein, partial [Bacillota bacterium]
MGIDELLDAISPGLLMVMVGSGLLLLVWDARLYRNLGFRRDEAVARWCGWFYIVAGAVLMVWTMVVRYRS